MEFFVYFGGGELNRFDEYIVLCMIWFMMVFFLKKNKRKERIIVIKN